MVDEHALKAAIVMAQRGNKAEALRILAKVVQQDPRSEEAWLWVSRCVDTSDRMIFALQKAVAINPHNELARWKLDELLKTPPGGPPPEPLPDTRPMKATAVHVPQPIRPTGTPPDQPEAGPQPARKVPAILWIVFGASLLFTALVLVAFVAYRTEVLRILSALGIVLP